MADATNQKMLAWLEKQKTTADKEDLGVINTLIQVVKNPISSPAPSKIERWGQFVAAYKNFHEAQTSTKPRLKPAEAKNLKEIIYFLLEQDTIQDEEQALKALEYIFKHWESLSPFLQNQVSLTQLNKYLSEILKQLKSGHHAKKANKQTDRNQLKDQLKS